MTVGECEHVVGACVLGVSLDRLRDVLLLDEDDLPDGQRLEELCLVLDLRDDELDVRRGRHSGSATYRIRLSSLTPGSAVRRCEMTCAPPARSMTRTPRVGVGGRPSGRSSRAEDGDSSTCEARAAGTKIVSLEGMHSDRIDASRDDPRPLPPRKRFEELLRARTERPTRTPPAPPRRPTTTTPPRSPRLETRAARAPGELRAGTTADGRLGAPASGRRADSQRAGDGAARDAHGGTPSRCAPDRGDRADRARCPCPSDLGGRARSTVEGCARGHGCPGQRGRAGGCSAGRGGGAGAARARAGGAHRALRAERPTLAGAHAAGHRPRPTRGPACRAGRGCPPALLGTTSVGERAGGAPSRHEARGLSVRSLESVFRASASSACPPCP